MKKILACIICLTLAFGVTACGKASDKDSNGDTKIISDAKNKQENSKSDTKKEVSKKEVAGDAGKGKSSKSKSKTNSNKIDVDLNNLNANVVYSQVFLMMTEPDKFIGKRIRMSGQFNVYAAQEGNPSGVTEYYAIIIADAQACCQQGIEFVWPGHTYPEGFPEVKSNASVTGIFEVYEENGKKYCRLVADSVEQL
ncbi:putative lipoprotein [Eubacterium sulci ATCC 35585]|nr:putative lipoprotein [Eubacterium sulci ATCC 35585]